MGSQIVRHDWATELNWTYLIPLLLDMLHVCIHVIHLESISREKIKKRTNWKTYYKQNILTNENLPVVIHKNKHVRSIGIICKNNNYLDPIREVKILYAIATKLLKYLVTYLTKK